MAAQAQPQQQRREQIDFPPNVATTVSMKYAQPKLVSGMSGDRYLFTTCDNRVFFLDPEVAGQIAAKGINVREEFTITRKTDGKKGSPVTWEVARIAAPAPAMGEQPNGTYVVPRDPAVVKESLTTQPAPKPMARADNAGSVLVEQSIILVDAYAAVLKHALDAHQGRVKPDEVRAIFLTCAINRQRGAA